MGAAYTVRRGERHRLCVATAGNPGYEYDQVRGPGASIAEPTAPKDCNARGDALVEEGLLAIFHIGEWLANRLLACAWPKEDVDVTAAVSVEPLDAPFARVLAIRKNLGRFQRCAPAAG
jgi:hypothetical protein